MVWGNISRWSVLERRSPVLFLSAGVLLVGYAALNGIVAATDMGPAPIEDVVGPAGFVLGFLGLLGLYPRLADRTPRLARAGAICVGFGAVAFSVITVHGLAVVAGLEPGKLPILLLVPVAIGMIPGYLLFGVASLRADVRPRSVGLVLFLPGLVFAAMLSQPVVYGQLGMFSETTMAWSNFAISSGQAVAHLAIGYGLWTGVAPDEREASVSDVTLG